MLVNEPATTEGSLVCFRSGSEAWEGELVYVNKRQFVSPASNTGLTELAGSDIANMNSIALNVSILPITPTQNYVFARTAVKIAGVEDMLFTSPSKVSL